MRCKNLGVERIVLPGVLASGWKRLWRFVEHEAMLWAAFGLHPLYSAQHSQDDITHLSRLLTSLNDHPKFCALGEIGLDYWSADADRTLQQDYLAAQLQLAEQFKRPVLLHVRRAHAPTLALLKSARLSRGGIVHAFSGSFEEAKAYWNLGFRLGFGGVGTWPQAKRLHRLLKELPLEAIVLETDAPDLAPASHPNHRNSPEYLPDICQTLARIRGMDPQAFAEATYRNSCCVFGWPT